MSKNAIHEPVWLNRAISFFILLFLASLTNSIFVNQIGYYGALLLTIAKIIYTKENKFFKAGIELPIILFFLAELISTIVSQNQPQSIEYMFKRIILLPVIYTIAANVINIKQAKLFFTVYIVFAVISAVIYDFYSYDYIVKGLFQIKGAGPDFFHYPITTSELLSFSAIFIFAFLINEKRNWKIKLLTFISFGITLLALLATYKRTGWIGFAAGIILILVMKRRYKSLAVLTMCGIALFFIEKDESKIYSFDLSENKLELISEYKGDGKAQNLYFDGSQLLISDFDNGLLSFSDVKVIQELEVPSAIETIKKNNKNNFIAFLIDTRFLLLENSKETGFKIKNEFFTKGMTRDFDIRNNSLFVIDTDSGLTVFPNVLNPDEKIYFNTLNGFTNISLDSNFIALYSRNKGLEVLRIKDGLPGDIENSFKVSDGINFASSVNNELLFSSDKGIAKLDPVTNEITYLKSKFDPGEIYSCLVRNNRLFFTAFNGAVKEISLPLENELTVIGDHSLGFIPRSIEYANDKLYVSKVKTSRLLSIFDPNQPSNFSRLAMWSTGINIFLDYPLFGVGDISVEKIYREYKKPYYKEVQGHMHNNYIHFLVILGGFGFAAVMFLLIKILVIKVKIFKTVEDEKFTSSYALGALGCFISFLVAGLTEWNFGDHEIITMVWFITGLNFAIYKIKKSAVH